MDALLVTIALFVPAVVKIIIYMADSVSYVENNAVNAIIQPAALGANFRLLQFIASAMASALPVMWINAISAQQLIFVVFVNKDTT